jgi:hypothetical protein
MPSIEQLILFFTILILVATVFPFFYYYLRRPQLHLDTHIETEKLLENGIESIKVTFWMRVRNSGCESAKCSQPMVKLTDTTGKIEVVTKLSYPSPGLAFPLDWLVAGEPKEQVEIPQTGKGIFLHQFRLPLFMIFATNQRKQYVMDGPQGRYVGEPEVEIQFEEPIKKWEAHAATFGKILEKGVAFELGIEVISPSVKKRFAVLSLPVMPTSKYEPKDVVFKLKD